MTSTKRFSLSRAQAVLAAVALFGIGATLLPPVAEAAGIGAVRIADATTTRKAQVTTQGRLRVDPLMNRTFSRSFYMAAGTIQLVKPNIPSGSSLRLTSITIADDPGIAGSSIVVIKPSLSGCSSIGDGLYWTGTTAHGETHQSVFPTPLYLADRCAMAWNPGNSSGVFVTITGFLVP